MRVANALTTHRAVTHEGALAVVVSPLAELRRAVSACLLWEDQFYESGEAIADRIRSLVAVVPFKDVADLAIEARGRMNLRHVPLWLVVALFDAAKARGERLGKPMGDLIAKVIQRADEVSELLALWWKSGKRPIPKQMKRGIGLALNNFNAYHLAKNDRPGAVRIRDALFLCHAKPNEGNADLFKLLANDELPAPDTWETQLSSGADKRATFERLIGENKLGALALLRNLRGMTEAGVPDDVIRAGLKGANVERVLPFRFITAATHAPQFEPELEELMFRVKHEMLPGNTVLLVDVSGSMVGEKVSKRSELDRRDAAIALAMLCREVCEHVRIIAFTDSCVEVPPRRGFGLRDAILRVPSGGTRIGQAVQIANSLNPDRIVAITDEQSADAVPGPCRKGYMVNVASHKPSVAYGPWVSITGWSESVVEYIRQSEA